jgi:hypothetical protein
MQNYCKTIGALAAASALVAGNASAEVEYDLHTGYSTMYLWRGLDLGDDLIEVGANVKGEWNGIGLSAGAWYGTFEAPTGVPLPFNSYDGDELDLYMEVSKDFGFAKFAVGYIAYLYEQANANNALFPLDNQQEIYFAVSRDFGFVNASLTYFWGLERDALGYNNEGYTEFALSRSFEINQCLKVNVLSSVGLLTDGIELAHWTNKVSLDWAFTEHAKLSPFVALSIALGDDNSTPWVTTDNEFVAGSMLSVSF